MTRATPIQSEREPDRIVVLRRFLRQGRELLLGENAESRAEQRLFGGFADLLVTPRLRDAGTVLLNVET
jgi:hypothetical protein